MTSAGRLSDPERRGGLVDAGLRTGFLPPNFLPFGPGRLAMTPGLPRGPGPLANDGLPPREKGASLTPSNTSLDDLGAPLPLPLPGREIVVLDLGAADLLPRLDGARA